MAKELDFRQKMVVALMDVLLLGELTFSIYFGHLDPENMTFIFLRTFLPLAAGTVLLSMVLVRILRRGNGKVVSEEEVHGQSEFLH